MIRETSVRGGLGRADPALGLVNAPEVSFPLSENSPKPKAVISNFIWANNALAFNISDYYHRITVCRGRKDLLEHRNVL